MAAPNPRPAPILVEYPTGTFKRDELTTGGVPRLPLTATQQDILRRVISGPLPSNPNLQLVRLAPPDGTTCYRNAVLGMLFNLKSFLNLLHEAARKHPQPNRSLTLLRDVAALYWDATQSTSQRRANLPRRVQAWWREFGRIEDVNGVSWRAKHGGRQVDASELYDAVLNHARDVEYPQDEAEVLEALLRLELIQRRAYDCDCKEKQRQLFGAASQLLWYRSINAVRAHTPLASLVSNMLYEHMQERRDTCPTCGRKELSFHAYDKFANLPEVFMVELTYLTHLDESDPTQSIRNDLAANTDQPERLDLTFLRDFSSDSQSPNTDPQAPAGRAIYELQSVIAYRTDDPDGRQGHYNLHVKRPDGTWTTVDDYSTVEVREGQPALNLRGNYRARMLAYVRVRDASAAQPTPSSTAVPIAHNPVIQTAGNDQIDKPLVQQQAPVPAHLQATPSQPVSGSVQTSTQHGQVDSNAGDATIDPALDAANWTQQRLLSELKRANINIGRTKKVEKLRDIWNRFQASNEDQKLDFLLKDELRNIMDSLNLEYDVSSTNDVLIRSIMRRRRAALSSDNTDKAQVGKQTGTQANKDDETAAPDADQTTDTQSAGVATATTNVSTLQDIIKSYTQSNADLRKHNNKTQRDLDTSREQNRKDFAQIQIYQDQITDLKRRLAECQAAQAHPQHDPNQPLQSVLSPAQQASVALNNALASPQQPQNQQSLPSTADGSGRVLRVITYDAVGKINPATNQVEWNEGIKYLCCPSYVGTLPLTTTSWTSTVNLAPDASNGNARSRSELSVYIAIKSQDGGKSPVYMWTYISDVKVQDRPEAYIDIELLTTDAVTEVQKLVEDGVHLVPEVPSPAGTPTPAASAAPKAPLLTTAPGDKNPKRPRPHGPNEGEQQSNTKKVRFDGDGGN